MTTYVSPTSDLVRHALVFVATFAYGSFFEYTFHRCLMHDARRHPAEAYRNHMLHHATFHGDHSYYAQRIDDRHLILFEWWQGPLMVACHGPVLWALGVATGWPVLGPSVFALTSYYALYEYLHWCMHSPAHRRIEDTTLFRFLCTNHRLHHGSSRVNFNVVLPLADLVFGTLQRSPACSPAKRRTERSSGRTLNPSSATRPSSAS